MNARIILEESTDKKRGVKASIGVQTDNKCRFCDDEIDPVRVKIKEKDGTISAQYCSKCEVFYIQYKDYIDNLDYFYQWDGASKKTPDGKTRKIINKHCFRAASQSKTCKKCHKRLQLAIVDFKRKNKNSYFSRTEQCCPVCGSIYIDERKLKKIREAYDLSASLFNAWANDENEKTIISEDTDAVPAIEKTASHSSNENQDTNKAHERIIAYTESKKKCPICSRQIKTANARIMTSAGNKYRLISLRYCTACDVFITKPSSLIHLKNEYDFSTAQFDSWIGSEKKPEKKVSALKNKAEKAIYKPIGHTNAITYYGEAPKAKIITPVQGSGAENYKDVVYCKVVLQSAITGRALQVSVSSTAEEHMNGPTLMVPCTSEKGRICAKAALKHLNEIYIDSTKYHVEHTNICNISMVEAIVNNNAPANSYGSKQPVSSIDYSVKQPLIHVYYRLTNSCMQPSSSHDVESLTMTSTNAKTGMACDINVYHCKTCGKYFVNNEALQLYNSRDIYPLVKFSLENDFTGSFRPNSILSIYGYNVKEGELTEPQRHRILSYIVDSGITTKAEAIRILQGFVNLNGNKAGNQKARARWEDDIQFLSEYTKGNHGRINGKFIFQNK